MNANYWIFAVAIPPIDVVIRIHCYCPHHVVVQWDFGKYISAGIQFGNALILQKIISGDIHVATLINGRNYFEVTIYELMTEHLFAVGIGFYDSTRASS